MKPQRLIWTLGWITMSSLAALQGCGDDEDDTASGGKGGKGGTSGAAGDAGDGGTAGNTGGTGGNTGGTGGNTGGTAGNTGGTAGTPTGGAGGVPSGGQGGQGGEGGAGEDRLTVCTAYCQGWVDKDCELSAANTYTDEPDCRDTCMNADWEIGEPGVGMGNTINCRLQHTMLAADPSPGPDETHCGHASENSTGNCVP